MFEAPTAYQPAQTFAPPPLPTSLPATTRTWTAYMGKMWGRYKVMGHNAAHFAGEGDFTIFDDGRIELMARYDPPGTWWMALLATFVTGVIIVLIAQNGGFAAGPGWLPWFMIITWLRRRQTTTYVQNAHSIVVDAPQRRLGFFADFEGQQQWLVFDAKENFDEVWQNLNRARPAGVYGGRIDRSIRPFTIFVFVVLGLLAVMILFAIVAILGMLASVKR